MALQLSTAVRNARLDTIESTVGTTAKLILYGGSVPANCAASASATVIATLTLPSDWMAAASSGSKAKSGTWEDTSADATGTVTHFRIWDNTVSACGMQGTVTATSGGGDMEIQNTSVTSGQAITVTSFTLTDGNA